MTNNPVNGRKNCMAAHTAPLQLVGDVVWARRCPMEPPEIDRLVVTNEHSDSCYYNGGDFLAVKRSDSHVTIQITVLAKRSVVQNALYAAIAENLCKEPSVCKKDIYINLLEVAKEDFSPGNGIAQFACFWLNGPLRRAFSYDAPTKNPYCSAST